MLRILETVDGGNRKIPRPFSRLVASQMEELDRGD
jgi:hypothetical protein